ncbi:hypothetical protein J6590_042044 [Homalodisca vitripennis]|nr:hypothetical protein J6590_042044 [Homalodisca vitripennis]
MPLIIPQPNQCRSGFRLTSSAAAVESTSPQFRPIERKQFKCKLSERDYLWPNSTGRARGYLQQSCCWVFVDPKSVPGSGGGAVEASATPDRRRPTASGRPVTDTAPESTLIWVRGPLYMLYLGLKSGQIVFDVFHARPGSKHLYVVLPAEPALVSASTSILYTLHCDVWFYAEHSSTLIPC